MMAGRLLILLLGCSCLVLSACAPAVTATVTVHHTLPDSTRLTRYAFVPLKDQETGIENAEYRSAIRKELQRYNYVESDQANATLLLSYSHGISDGKIMPPSGMFDPATYTEYRRGLWIFLYEKKQGRAEEDELKIVYEGSVVGAGPLMQVSNAMPAMIRALFRDFPGDSGRPHRVFIDP